MINLDHVRLRPAVPEDAETSAVLHNACWREADGPCSLWVLEDNERARGFYARNGFVPDGGRELHDDLGTWEIRMIRR